MSKRGIYVSFDYSQFCDYIRLACNEILPFLYLIISKVHHAARLPSVKRFDMLPILFYVHHSPTKLQPHHYFEFDCDFSPLLCVCQNVVYHASLAHTLL